MDKNMIIGILMIIIYIFVTLLIFTMGLLSEISHLDEYIDYEVRNILHKHTKEFIYLLLWPIIIVFLIFEISDRISTYVGKKIRLLLFKLSRKFKKKGD